jgi:hypothetical protein
MTSSRDPEWVGVGLVMRLIEHERKSIILGGLIRVPPSCLSGAMSFE